MTNSDNIIKDLNTIKGCCKFLGDCMSCNACYSIYKVEHIFEENDKLKAEIEQLNKQKRNLEEDTERLFKTIGIQAKTIDKLNEEIEQLKYVSEVNERLVKRNDKLSRTIINMKMKDGVEE